MILLFQHSFWPLVGLLVVIQFPKKGKQHKCPPDRSMPKQKWDLFLSPFGMRAQGADGGGHGEGGRGQRREGKEQGIKSLAGLRIEYLLAVLPSLVVANDGITAITGNSALTKSIQQNLIIRIYHWLRFRGE